MTSAINELIARVKALEAALRPFVETSAHTRTFLVTREKMNPVGVMLWDEDVQRAAEALKRGEP